MNEYCMKVLTLELSKPDYDGMKADTAWSWLMEPTVTEHDEPTNLKLTPLVAAGVLGPIKANAITKAVRMALPDIADSLLAAGVNVSDPATGAFLDSLTQAGIAAEDIATLKALGTRKVTVTTPRRFDSRFFPELWPDVDGTGTINGFPNTIDRADFDKAWEAAGRNV